MGMSRGLRIMRLGLNKQAGFTLLELLMVLGIAGILIALVAPTMSESIAKRRVYGDYKSIRDVLRVAKSAGQTDKRFSGVVVCPSTDAVACSGTNWSNGFIACGDVDSDSNCTSSDVVVAVQDQLSNNTRLTVTKDGTAISTIALTTQGYTAAFSASDAPTYLFTYCNLGASSSGRTRSAMGVVYGPGGVIRMAIDTDSDGTPNFGTANLTCPSS